MPARRRWDANFRSPHFSRESRLATHRSILGPDARCDHCEETRIQALIRRKREIICYECLSEEQGRSRVEMDHPLGRGERWVRYTRPLPANRHRLVSHPDVDAYSGWADDVPDGAGQDTITSGLGLRFGTDARDPGLVEAVIDPPDDDPTADGTLVVDGERRRDTPTGPAGARPASVRGPARPTE